MFKNYNILIFKDRESGVHNVKLRGWLTLLLVLVFIALAGMNAFLWGFYRKAINLEEELTQAQKTIQGQDSQVLTLAGKLQHLEQDVQRVQQFDAKLRALMNIGIDQEQSREPNPEANAENAEQKGNATILLQNPEMLAQHRELFSRHMHSLIDELSTQTYLEEIGQQEILQSFRSNKDVLSSTPSIWPAEGYLSSGFGYRRSPFTGRSTLHAGIDIANRPGTNIIAPASGTVTFSGWDGAYGFSIIIDHGNNIATRYAHLRKSMVKERQFIQRGDVIATMGSSGRSTGPHLHYEVRIGNVPVNPMRYILN